MAEISDLAGDLAMPKFQEARPGAEILESICKKVNRDYWGQPRIHLMKAREIEKIRETKWKGLANHFVDYGLQEWNALMDKVAVFIYERYPLLGDIYDVLNPLPPG
ncbi:MAG: hypothetical protein K6T16_00095 [Candidatus Pacearchaeota archaeon]|nr:hypothetical protein [Candidatus Pacearchaeota archaeon]